jgi:ribosomal protein L19
MQTLLSILRREVDRATSERRPMKVGDKVTQVLSIAGDKGKHKKAYKGTVISVNERHRHYTAEFKMPPCLFRDGDVWIRESFFYTPYGAK